MSQNKDFFLALEAFEKEKGIDSQAFITSLENALAVACKRQFGEQSNVSVKLNPEKYTIRCYISKIVVEEVETPEKEISLQQAQEIKKSYKLGDEVLTEIFPKDFGLIAVQNAKQVILHSLHQAEKDLAYSQFAGRENQLIIGVVSRIKDDGTVLVEIGKNQIGVLAPQDQIPGERFQNGQRVKVLIKRVKDSTKGTQIVLSRENYMFIKRLFEAEVPEIASGIVEIKSIVREAGFRTKIAVFSNDDNIDAVGSCVGSKGLRVNSIVNEIGGEKIDIIPWSEDPLDYIARALSPAKVLIVQANEETHEAKVIVPDEKLSLAIGKEGQNARLAARLTGWKIDVKSYTTAVQSGMFDAEEQGEIDDQDAQ
ncbi:MAG: transcription termination/antitermination protein NusA [Clostridia bacterium]|nr:transcription termination/antitermination protein NusA [Clostridia bacterium]